MQIPQTLVRLSNLNLLILVGRFILEPVVGPPSSVRSLCGDDFGVLRASGRASNGPANVGHAKVDGRRANGCLSHGLELLVGGGEGVLDGGDFTEPALFLGLGETVDEVGVDLFESGLLCWVNAKEGTSDAGFSELWGRSVPKPLICSSLKPNR
jgi:hypothetical protein